MPKEDGKNADDGAQKDSAERIAQLEKEVEKQKGIAANAETVFQKWSAEQGEARKVVAEAMKEIAALKETIEGLKKSGVPGKREEAEETAEDIEKSLSAEQRTCAEAVFAQLSEDDKMLYASDEKFRKSFLSRTRETVKPIPASPWTSQQKPTPKTPDTLERRIQDLFEKQKRRSVALPTGPSRDQHAATGNGPERREAPARSAVAASVLGNRRPT